MGFQHNTTPPTEPENAKITSSFLGKEGHGIPSFMLECKVGGSSQGFGGYSLRHPSYHDLIFKILDAVGAESWEKLAGSYCRIRRNDPGRIVAIGHITEDRWLDMRDYESG